MDSFTQRQKKTVYVLRPAPDSRREFPALGRSTWITSFAARPAGVELLAVSGRASGRVRCTSGELARLRMESGADEAEKSARRQRVFESHLKWLSAHELGWGLVAARHSSRMRSWTSSGMDVHQDAAPGGPVSAPRPRVVDQGCARGGRRALRALGGSGQRGGWRDHAGLFARLSPTNNSWRCWWKLFGAVGAAMWKTSMPKRPPS